MIIQWILLCIVLVILVVYIVMSLGMLGAARGAPFIPSGKKALHHMIKAADIQPTDTVFDLGCGDGRLVFAADRAGAHKTVGIEISYLVYLLARIRNFFYGSERTEIRHGNFFNFHDVREADVIFVFLLPVIMDKVFEEIWPHMRPGAKVVSHAFTPKGFTPNRVLKNAGTFKNIYVFQKENIQS